MTAAFKLGMDQERVTCEGPGCARMVSESDGQDGLCLSCAAEHQDHHLGLHDDQPDLDCPRCW